MSYILDIMGETPNELTKHVWDIQILGLFVGFYPISEYLIEQLLKMFFLYKS